MVRVADLSARVDELHRQAIDALALGRELYHPGDNVDAVLTRGPAQSLHGRVGRRPVIGTRIPFREADDLGAGLRRLLDVPNGTANVRLLGLSPQ